MINDDIINDAIKTWGADSQLDCTIEELSELIKEIIKYKRGFENKSNLTEELADVMIMIEQVIKICDIDKSDIDAVILQKISRLQKRLKEYKYDQ